LVSKQTISDKNVNFKFMAMPIVDSATYFFHATTKRGGNGAYTVDLDKPEWPVFSANEPQVPWYVNTNPVQLKTADTLLHNQAKLEQLTGMGKVLKEVNIVEKKIVKGSHNLNGPGKADQVIDEKDIAKAGRVTLLDLIKQQVKGFRMITRGVTVTGEPNDTYFIQSERIGSFIVDGIDPRVLHIPASLLLSEYTTDDIKGIEVMSIAYTSSYEMEYGPVGTFPVPFLEITTRDGTGPVLRKRHPGLAMYMLPPLVSDKAFYRPAYPIKNSTTAANDTRTTVHWEPNVITDKDGKATVTFYAASQPATYTITVEGSNMNGNVGSFVGKIFIK
jgi:hypothetical protein